MCPGKSGVAGAGIYFAMTKAIACRKARLKGAVITARVVIGWSFIIKRSIDLTENALAKLGCDSVKVFNVVKDEEYVVYDPRKISILQV
jgi:hypothetical protein